MRQSATQGARSRRGRLLDGRELAGFIKERQAKQVRALRQAHNVSPRLAIVVTINSPVTETYMRLKQEYGSDILVEVEIHRVKQADVSGCIKTLNKDRSNCGIVLQLPLTDPSQTEELCNLIYPNKDVDGLGDKAAFEPATPLAIRWLLAGYGVELAGKQILVVGQGKLVGRPLTKIWQAEDLNVQVADIQTKDLGALTREADVIVTATGAPGLIKSGMLKEGAVVVDAGTASEGGKIVGDLDPVVYEREDLTLTPQKGGVGPLTICALFDNVIRAASPDV